MMSNSRAGLSEKRAVIGGGNGESLLKHLKKEWRIYTFFIIPVAFYVIFKYLPMAGNIIAFRKYRAGGSIFGNEWVGLRYFKQFVMDISFWKAFRNTLTLNITYLLVRFPMTLIFALLLNEVRNIAVAIKQLESKAGDIKSE